jgi:hypothetical protein
MTGAASDRSYLLALFAGDRARFSYAPTVLILETVVRRVGLQKTDCSNQRTAFDSRDSKLRAYQPGVALDFSRRRRLTDDHDNLIS